MPTLFLYLIRLSCSLGLVWLFYRIVLHKLTFYTLNRWYLLGYSLFSFLIPIINIAPLYREDAPYKPSILRYIPVIGKPEPEDRVSFSGAPFWDNAWNDLLIFLGLISFLLLVQVAVRWLSLRRIRRRAILLEQNPIAIYQVDEDIAPFSFGNAVYINRHLHDESEWRAIILHECVHIRQRHSVDILLGELLLIVNWYNPFAWLIRYSMRQNLEFIADRAVVETGVDKKGYQYQLLKVAGRTSYQPANNFNLTSLKKRIVMMNKIRSTPLQLLRFLFILPLVAALLVACRHESLSQQAPAANISTVPALPKALWIVDGKECSQSTAKAVPFGDIVSVDVFKGPDAVNLFGSRGANGVIAVITKAYQNKLQKTLDPATRPLFIVNGQERPYNIIGDIDVHRIDSINVFKDSAATARYGDKARNGVIQISLKKD